jgi:hypothetical protein
LTAIEAPEKNISGRTQALSFENIARSSDASGIIPRDISNRQWSFAKIFPIIEYSSLIACTQPIVHTCVSEQCATTKPIMEGIPNLGGKGMICMDRFLKSVDLMTIPI